MLLKLLITFSVIFILFLLAYILCLKFKKDSGILLKLTGLVSLISLLFSIVLTVIYIKSNDIKLFNRLNSYDIKKVYSETLAKSGADQAYPLLPVKIFNQAENHIFLNSQNDAFLMNKAEDGYEVNTVANKVSFIDSSKTLKATVTTEGELILDGYFLYSEYDEFKMIYDNEVIAENVEYCSVSSNSLFYVTKSGDLYSMGFNEYGQLADGTTKNKTKPVFVKSDIAIASVSDTHAMIIDKFGTLYAVGDNSYSQLGTKNAVSTTELTKIMQGIKDVYAGNYFTLVLTVNGELYTAGKNDKGQLANGGALFKAELVHALSGVDKIEAIGNTCSALTYSGDLYVWGDNTDFKAGYNKEENISSPVKIAQNVYDFSLSDKGIAYINKDRDIMVTNELGEIEIAVTFGAQIPEGLKEKFSPDLITSDKKV